MSPRPSLSHHADRELTSSLAWTTRAAPNHQSGPHRPFAATYAEAREVCDRMNAEWPALRHWPVFVHGGA
jgi:hypothetical protein